MRENTDQALRTKVVADTDAGPGVNFCNERAPDQSQAKAAVLSSLDDAAIERKLKSIIEHRRSRLEYFPKELFADPAWDILLDLALAERQHRRVCVSSLCIAAQVPATTALRWIRQMTEDGWLIREVDQHDHRRTFVKLSHGASINMLALVARIKDAHSV